MQQIQNLRSVIAIFWLGFFMAISFMEAPLKFMTPGISISTGVAIGRVVFSALNKCEWIFFLILLATWFLNRPRKIVTIMMFAVGVVLLLQTFWVLPILDERAAMISRSLSVPQSNMHVVYVILEIIKVPVLFVIGWKSIYRTLLFA